MTSDHIRHKANALRAIAGRLGTAPATARDVDTASRLETLARQLDELAGEAEAFEEAAYEAFARLGRAEHFLRSAAADANRQVFRAAIDRAAILKHPVLPQNVTDLAAWRRQRDEETPFHPDPAGGTPA